jgi:HAD superfamily hydrolase (TIGR01490 family)
MDLIEPQIEALHIAIFDLDGTLTRGDTYLPFLLRCLQEFGLRKWSALLFPYHALMYLGGVITNSQFKELLLNNVLGGISMEQLQPVIRKFSSEIVKNKMNHDMICALQCHKIEKHRVILATASLDLYVREISERLGISEVACTSVEVVGGHLTGRLLGKNCHGAEKANRLEKLLGSSDLEHSIFYTDHHSDLPLLKKVKQGILVRPGLRTRFLLQKYGFSLFRP